MIEYKIVLDCGLLFVTTNDGQPRQGPYKNEESAKRRIRDLKRKDISAGVHSDLVTPSVEKLAISSEYGKSNALAEGMNNLDMSKFKIDRPRGVYPAVSKHSYQR